MNCRKCGARKITKRKSGVFSCNHCGIQPGPLHLDRAGIPQKTANETATEEKANV